MWQIKKPERYGQPVTSFVYVNMINAESPETYNNAINSNGSDLWNEAMDKEIASINKSKTWKLVDKPTNKKILDLKCVCTNKVDGRKKARVVVKGSQRDKYMEDIHPPVASMQTLKLLKAYCNQNNYEINQMGVVTGS